MVQYTGFPRFLENLENNIDFPDPENVLEIYKIRKSTYNENAHE